MDVNKELFGIVEMTGNVAQEYKGPFQGKDFQITVTNTGSAAEDRLLALGIGWHQNAADITDEEGNVVAAILKEGEVIDTANQQVTAAGKNCDVTSVVRMLSTTPCRLKGIRVKVDDAEQLNEEIQILELTPRRPKLIHSIIPSSQKDESNNDSTIASISLLENLVVLGADRLLLLNVAAGRTVTLTMFYENRASFAKQLEVAIQKNLIQ